MPGNQIRPNARSLEDAHASALETENPEPHGYLTVAGSFERRLVFFLVGCFLSSAPLISLAVHESRPTLSSILLYIPFFAFGCALLARVRVGKRFPFTFFTLGLLAPAILVLISSGIFVLQASLWKLEFNPATWREHHQEAGEDSDRLRMLDDLLDNHALVGRSANAIDSLLGPPSFVDEEESCHYYALDQASSDIDRPGLWLALAYGEDERVISTFTSVGD